MRKMKVFLLITIFVAALVFKAASSDALGMGTLGSKEFEFVPGKEVDISVLVTNSVNAAFPIKVYPSGEIAEYLTLKNEENEIVLGSKGSARFDFKLKMPMSFDKPGEHSAFIFAEQIPPEDAGGMIGIIRIGNKIIIHVPYPGKYIDSWLSVENTRVKQDVTFSIEVNHRGSELINDIYADVHVFDEKDEKIATVRTNNMILQSDTTDILEGVWYADVKPGKYKVIADIYYDGETKKTNDYNFNLGSPSIKITEIINDTIVNGTVAKIPVKVKSEWNIKINDVFAELKIFDESGNEIETIKSETINIGPWAIHTFNLFWDTRNANVGEYKASVDIHYLEEKEHRDFSLVIEPVQGFYSEASLIYIIVAVIVLALMTFTIIRRRGRSSGGGYYTSSFSK